MSRPMVDSSHTVLLLGGAGAGKTTLLIQLLGRAQTDEGRLTLRDAPPSLRPVQAGLARLSQGLAVLHTAQGTDVSLTLPLQTPTGHALDIEIPDYAGEDLQAVVTKHTLSERWRRLAGTSSHWILLIRLSRHLSLPDIISRPIGETARAPSDIDSDGAGQETDVLPADLWAVELLQMLLFARGAGPRGNRTHPRITLLLSCWDELGVPDGTRPSEVAAERLALLHNFCRNNWASPSYAVLGLSAQGKELSENDPDSGFRDSGAHEMGWIVRDTGAKDADLSIPLDR